MSNRGIGGSLGWAAATALGAWLSVSVARRVTALAGVMGGRGAGEPVREIVEEALAEHQAEDRPMVHAFEEALGAEEGEPGARVS